MNPLYLNKCLFRIWKENFESKNFNFLKWKLSQKGGEISTQKFQKFKNEIF